jgi:XTP/dITP diphosphohydrolase
LTNLADKEDRSGYYKAVICLIWDEQTYFFEGICKGTIVDKPTGEGGFGYDPIFIPDGYSQTFAQLSPEIKNSISHRGIAVRKMIDFLRDRIG